MTCCMRYDVSFLHPDTNRVISKKLVMIGAQPEDLDLLGMRYASIEQIGPLSPTVEDMSAFV